MTTGPEGQNDPTRVEGPPMICATSVLRPGGYRVGKLFGGYALPRTVPIVTAVLVVIFAVLGLVLALVVSGGQPYSIGLGIGLGGAIGYAMATFSPLRGESMMTWIILLIRGSRRRQRIDGRPVTLAVGATLATRIPHGPVTIRRSSVRVNPTTRDDRGVMAPTQEQTLTKKKKRTKRVKEEKIRKSSKSKKSKAAA